MKLSLVPLILLTACSGPVVSIPEAQHDSVGWKHIDSLTGFYDSAVILRPKDTTQFIFDGPRFGFVYYPASDSVEVWGRDTVGLVKWLIRENYKCQNSK